MPYHFGDYIKKTKEYGIVEQIKYPIIYLSGLPDANPNEVIVFESGQIGRVVALERDLVEVMLLDSRPVKIGVKATRTLQKLTIGVSKDLLGKAINPLGASLLSNSKGLTGQERRPIDIEPAGVPGRARITAPFVTGSAVCDTLLPLGKGQRELIVGDRKTGKTAFILTAIKAQAASGTVIVYSAIGKRKTEIKKLISFFEDEKISKNVVLVASSSDDCPSLVYLTPYSAMTIAEFFCEKGNDVLIVLDDLTTHAKFYREIALLGRKFPGRESYPGDMFYTHARLLERAGNFKHPEKGEVSITALPVAETVEGDLRSYIVSNLISITDGHLLFSNSILNSGRKPAIDIFLSVTRVGKQTRGSMERDIATGTTAFLSRVSKLENVSHFGSELSEESNRDLAAGRNILSLFNQDYRRVYPDELQLILLTMIRNGQFDTETAENISRYRDALAASYKQDSGLQKVICGILESKTLDEGLTKLAKEKDFILNLCKHSRT